MTCCSKMLHVSLPFLDSRPQCPSPPPWQPGKGLGLSCGPAVISGVVGGGGGCIRPEKSSRPNVQKLTWRNSHWVRGYPDPQFSSMTINDVSPTYAIKRIILLYEKEQYREAANFINRLHRTTFKTILEDLPVDMFIEAIPRSLPILEALFAKVFLSDGLNFPMKLLNPESLIIHLADMLSHKDMTGICNEPNSILLSCKKLIKVIVLSEPRLKKQLMGRRRALEKAIDGMGQHGLVGTTDKTLMNLHEALKVEFERVIHLYKIALIKLDELCLAPKQAVTRSLSHGPAPTSASHQRQLSLRQDEIQERLIKNKTLLNVIEPTLNDNSLDLLLKILKKRVEIDKDIIFQFTQLKKEAKGVDHDSLVAPVLMRFSRGCSRVIEIMKELSDDGEGDMSSSDISGYHSDSDSAGANGSFQSKGSRRYNLMYSSVRLNSRSSSSCANKSRSTEASRFRTDFESGRSSESGRSTESGRSAESGRSTESGRFTESGRSSEGVHFSRNKQKTVSSKSNSPSSDKSPAVSIRTRSVSTSDLVSQLSDDSSCTLIAESEHLQREVENLKKDLKEARNTIISLQQREDKLRCRLVDQAKKMLERGTRFENLSLGEKRPSALIRRYWNLYAQVRIETLDALDALAPMHNLHELKAKIVFSVVVLSFRSVQNTLSDIKMNLRSLLQVKDFSTTDPTLKEIEEGVSLYFRKTADTFNLTKNAHDICAQIYATLYDYPCLRECEGLTNYIKECVRIAWGMANQNPPYVIDYETEVYKRDWHMRFHTSDSSSSAIKSYLWPVLLEGEDGPCVYKGIVIT